jgi:hypothetical protein
VADLLDFPDGGRATLVRRYSPALTKPQLTLLHFCPYENTPVQFKGDTLRQARGLVRLGLLEEDPTSKGNFRVTPAGAEVVHRWESAGWAP